MIFLYSGTPGSGKSMHAAREIYDNLKHTRKLVITNFPVNDTFIRRKSGTLLCMENWEITPEFLKRQSLEHFGNRKVKEGHILLILDEAELLFNSREWQRFDRREWLSFFNLHRHFGYDVIMIAQYDRMLDRQIRCNIEYEYLHRKVENFGIKGKIVSLLSMGRLHVFVKVWYPLKEKTGSEFFKAKKKYYRLYDSYAHFADTAVETEETVPEEIPFCPDNEPEPQLDVDAEASPEEPEEEIPETYGKRGFFTMLWEEFNNMYIRMFLMRSSGRRKNHQEH